MKHTPTGWHRADIIAALRKKGAPLASLARRLKLARCTMSWALMKPHPRANRAIAAELGVPMCELWPDWYGADGAPLFTRMGNRFLFSAPHSAPKQGEKSNLSPCSPATRTTRRKAA